MAQGTSSRAQTWLHHGVLTLQVGTQDVSGRDGRVRSTTRTALSSICAVKQAHRSLPFFFCSLCMGSR